MAPNHGREEDEMTACWGTEMSVYYMSAKQLSYLAVVAHELSPKSNALIYV